MTSEPNAERRSYLPDLCRYCRDGVGRTRKHLQLHASLYWLKPEAKKKAASQ